MTVLSFLFNLSIIYDYAALCGIIFFSESGETLKGHRNCQKLETSKIAEIRTWSENVHFQRVLAL